jgi:DNA polymerase-3 subunit epsilon
MGYNIGIFDFIAIDFETANYCRDSACQIGITTVKDGKIMDVKSWLINPDTFFDYYNIRLHGITQEMVKDQPTFDQLWSTIAPYFGDKEEGSHIIFAHNASFDIGVLIQMLIRYHIAIPEFVFGCSVAVSRRTWSGEASYNLDSMCRKLGISPGNHDAGEDSRACAEIVLKAAQEKEVDFSKEWLDGNDLIEIENKFKILFGEINKGWYYPCICQRLSKSQRLKKIIGDSAKNDPDCIFYEKHVVFTGTLSSMKRSDAQQIIADIGGINQNGVNKETDYLIVGQQDYRIVGEDGMSSKQEKAIKMINKGSALEILSEDDFLHSI